jgi:hypothetical protein
LAGALEKLTAPGEELYTTGTREILPIGKLTAVASVMMDIISHTINSDASLHWYYSCNVQNIL